MLRAVRRCGSWRVYDMVARHFIASLSSDMKLEQTTAVFQIVSERTCHMVRDYTFGIIRERNSLCAVNTCSKVRHPYVWLGCKRLYVQYEGTECTETYVHRRKQSIEVQSKTKSWNFEDMKISRWDKENLKLLTLWRLMFHCALLKLVLNASMGLTPAAHLPYI